MLEFVGGAALGALLFGGGSHTETRTHMVPYEKTVHEHRAPTDESVKLLREMEEAARNQVRGAFITKSNELCGAVIHTNPSIVGGYDIYVRFKLNGKTYETKHRLEDMNIAFDKIDALKMLCDSMSKEISRNMMEKLIGSGNIKL